MAMPITNMKVTALYSPDASGPAKPSSIRIFTP